MKMAVRGSMNLTSVRKIVTDKWRFYIEDCLRIICLNKNHIRWQCGNHVLMKYDLHNVPRW